MTRDLKVPGGVTNFFRIFFKNYDYDDILIEHFKQGISKEANWRQITPYILKYPFDIMRFILILIKDSKIKIIHFNPSFFTVPILRDSFYLLLSKAMGKKVVVFFHGWDNGFLYKMKRLTLLKKSFKWVYSKSDIIYVLAGDFKEELINMGFKNIEVTKTFFNGKIFEGYHKKKNKIPLLLYVGRMQEEKGIFLIIDALKRLDDKGRLFKMEFIGWFVDQETETIFNERIKKYDLKKKVKYLGYYSEKKKIEKFIESDIFLYPSYYPEGCPTVVIEAMAGGCFIISSNVAALKEVIENGKNGFIVKSEDLNDLFYKIESSLVNYELTFEKMKANRIEAFNKYESKKIIEQFHVTYINILRSILM